MSNLLFVTLHHSHYTDYGEATFHRGLKFDEVYELSRKNYERLKRAASHITLSDDSFEVELWPKGESK